MLRIAVLCVTLSSLGASAAWSQEAQTREEADRQRREQQATEVEAYQPNGVERVYGEQHLERIECAGERGFALVRGRAFGGRNGRAVVIQR